MTLDIAAGVPSLEQVLASFAAAHDRRQRSPSKSDETGLNRAKEAARKIPSGIFSKPSERRQTIVMVEGVDVTSKEFLRTYAWRTLRYRALQEGGSRCECCGASPATGAVINVDHIQPRRLRPDLALDLWNLQILCADCNAGKGNRDQTDWR